MAAEEISDPPSGDADGAGATEPITLTDPDGSVTRVAPWSSWTREQVRAPGGEPALVTRLEQGQLWFAAGRRRSPWRHEVLVGPATVSTPRGRFHVTAELDGGATIACLAGRTRVVAGLREPVVLGPDQTAAVASDGATLVVMDRTSGEPLSTYGDDAVEPPEPTTEVDVSDEPETDPPAVPLPAVAGGGDGGGDDGHGGDLPLPIDDDDHRRLPWLPEIVAVAALLAVLVAALVVFGGSSDDPQDLAAVATTSTTPPTSAGPTSTTEGDPTTTTAAPTTVASTTTVATSTTPPTAAAPGTADGALAACRRADGGVVATINLSHRSGGPGRFSVSVGLVDGGGQVFAQGVAESAVLDRGATQPVDVLVPVAGAVRGACELLGVTAA